MRILFTNQALVARGGTESYLETVMPALRQLGHEVTLFSPKPGKVAESFRTARFEVLEDADALQPVYDVVHAQHASTALTVRSRLPEVPMVFASHSWFLGIEDPPAEADPSAIVVFNDIVAERARASTLGERVPIHRLTQPVVIGTADPTRVEIRERPTRAFALSRNLSTRIGPLREACDELNITLTAVGRDATDVDDPTIEIMDADLVFGSGRVVLEALALGRAAFVYDETGSAGFVTEESYSRLESCGFTPEVGQPVDDLSEQIRAYEPRLGTLGREFVVRHHTAFRHAAALVEIFRATAPPTVEPAPPDVLERLAVVTQQAFDSESQARAALWEAARARRLIQDLEDRLHAARDRLDVSQDRLQVARDRLDSAQDRLTAAEAEVEALRKTTSWRITAPLRRLRRRRRRTA